MGNSVVVSLLSFFTGRKCAEPWCIPISMMMMMMDMDMDPIDQHLSDDQGSEREYEQEGERGGREGEGEQEEGELKDELSPLDQRLLRNPLFNSFDPNVIPNTESATGMHPSLFSSLFYSYFHYSLFHYNYIIVNDFISIFILIDFIFYCNLFYLCSLFVIFI